MYRGGCRHGRLMRVEPILFKQLSVFFLERDLLMDCMLLLDVPSEPVKVAERHAERVESGSPTGEVGIFRGFWYTVPVAPFTLFTILLKSPEFGISTSTCTWLRKALAACTRQPFPVKSVSSARASILSRCRNRHLASFGNEDEMV